MTERTKIERVGGHLLIGESAIPIASIRAFSFTKADVWCNVWSDNDAMDDAPIVAHGWTAREVLEVAYGSAPDEVTVLNATIDDLTRAGLEMERVKDEEIAVLREALQRVLGHYIAEAHKGDGIMEDAWDDVAAAMVLAKAEGPRFKESTIERGLASIREAAKVGR